MLALSGFAPALPCARRTRNRERINLRTRSRSERMSRVDDFISYLVWGVVAAYAVGTIGALLALWAFLRCLLLWPAWVGATLSLAAAVWLGGYRTRGATRGRRWAAGTCIGVAALCLVSDHLYPGTETAVSASPQSPAPPPPPSVCRRWCRKHEEVWTRKCLCDGGHANVPFGVACDGACSACSECLALQVADATAATADGPRSDLAAAGGVTRELRLAAPKPAAPPASSPPPSCSRLCLSHATGGEWPASPLWLALRRLAG